MVQRVSEKISEMDAVTTLSRSAVFPVTDGNSSYRVPLPRISRVFNVLNYGATGNGIATAASESAAFALADTAAAAVGGVVYVPKGTYGDGTTWTYAMSSGVSLEGDGSLSVLVNSRVTCTGTVGGEIAFTAPALAGANSISIPSTSLTNSWLHISSVINANSSDAGVNQLGDTASDASFLGEFVRVQTGSAGTATLYRRTLFPYSNTAGADSGSFTTSAARAVAFHQGSRIKRISFRGKGAANNDIIAAIWCRDLVIEDCNVDSNDLTAQNIRFDYCLDCHVRGGTVTGKLTSVPAGSTANQLIMASCQDCTAEGVTFEGGNQCVDITYAVGSIYRGGPSINCGALNCRAYNAATEGFTSHPGCWRSFFDNCDADGSTQGIRIRSRGDRVTGCRVSSIQGTGSGILVMGAALFDSDVSHNRIEGFVYGVEFRSSETGYTALRALLTQSMATIQSNTISNTGSEGIICIASPALATMIGPRILDNTIYSPGADGIEVASYVNGTVIDRNRIFGIAASQRGIRWGANIKRLWIGTNWVFNVNASGFGMGGPSTASFMTDATTFPAGEAEAFLYIGDLFTDAATPMTSILRNTVAYEWSYVAGYGGGALRGGRVLRGAGSPEGVVFAPLGATYQRTDGGANTSTYTKETAGTLSTGWVGK